VRVAGLLGRLLAAVVVVVASVGAAIWLLGGSSSSPDQAESTPPDSPRPKAAEVRTDELEKPSPGPLAADATASWESLAQTIPAQLGLALAPLGDGSVRSFGPLQTGHAWSTIKVPILVTRLRERQGQGLSTSEEGWARAALTASDNEAAAAIFGELEKAHGGLEGASLAVGETLRGAGDKSTAVATAPPPSGAVSTYGQTEWSLLASVEFFRALARGCSLDRADTERVLSLMEEVVPEQRWGLGEAGFTPSWQVAIKGGWGPEGSASGPYLVRQSGIVSDGGAGVAVAMMAQADSGSFDAGVEALNRVATWLADNLRSLGRADLGHC
jgi:hypothetical protein